MSEDALASVRVNVSTVLLQRPDGDVLLVREGARWTLPSVETRGHWHAEVAPIDDAVEQRFGLRARTLRTLTHDLDGEADRARLTVAVECLDPDWSGAANTRWASHDEVLAAADDPEREAIAEWFDQAAYDHARPLRTPWSRFGWFADALAWCTARLAERGIDVTGNAQRIKQWSIASILRMPTSCGDAWLKAVPPPFAHEGALLELIRPTMPDHLPVVMATDRARGWTLMEALPGATLRAEPFPGRELAAAAQDESMRLLARLQQAWIGRADDLLAVGCHDRRLHTLPGAIEGIIEREDIRERFSSEDLQRLRAFGATVPERVEALRACGVPETLMHGDFYPGNIATDGQRLVMFDWTDGCVSHPFFDLATFLPRDPVAHAGATHAYIEAWAPLVPAARVERAQELAEPLACVHHAVSYMRLMDGIDPKDRWEFDSDVLFWLSWLREILELTV